ncbi:MAG: hypothetical protein IT223_08040 [Crocinitomicaceae bacterium]|nr:hypothetical protein [Crocinitomicaceae bacterium]
MKHFLYSSNWFYLLIFSVGVPIFSFAQVQTDKKIELTGTGSEGRVTGITEVSDPTDAVSATSVQQSALTYGASTNNGNAFSVVLTPMPSYSPGLIVHFMASGDITGTATLNVNSLGDKAIKKNFNDDLAAGDIKNGQMVSVMYDGTHFQMLSQLGNSAGGGASCPSGYSSVNSKYCIEDLRHSATDWFAANNYCTANNARLCSRAEWSAACLNASGTTPSFESGLSTGTWEWLSDGFSDSNSYNASSNMQLVIGGAPSNRCKFSPVWSNGYGGYPDMGTQNEEMSSRWGSASNSYRCCYSK